MSRWFEGGGEAGSLVRSFDWAGTPLGPTRSWPKSLIHYVRLVLDLPSPAIIFWGPELIQIYNDGYAAIMGPRHPRYFGAPYRECWPDTYPLIHPWMERVLDRGEVVVVDKSQITVTRRGYAEEAYFTFTFSPLRDDDGAIRGIYQPVVQVSETVLSERRTETLRALEPRADSSDPVADAIAALSKNDKDIPFAVIYRWDESEHALRPIAATPNVSDPDVSLSRVAELARSVLDSSQPVDVENVPELLGGRRVGPWPEPTTSARLLPFGGVASHGPRGVAVLGISSRLQRDEEYGRFLELSTQYVASAIAAAHNTRRLKHLAFLAELAADLSRFDSACDIVQTVGAKLGAYLKLSSVQVCEMDESNSRITVDLAWGERGTPTFIRDCHHRLAMLLRQASRSDEVVVVRDTRSDPRTDWVGQAALGLGAFVTVPFREATERRAFIFACSPTARDWAEDEIELVKEVANRLFPRLERARAAEALRASEDRLQKAISIETVGVLFFTLDGRMLDANHALERLSGFEREELRRMDWKVLTPPEFMDVTRRTAEALATTGKAPPYEKQWIRPDGSRWWGLFAPTRLSGRGPASECVEFIVDITARKRFEAELRERGEFEQQLIGIVSHDLRTPLSAILLTAAGLLRVEQPDERTTRGLLRIQSSGARAARLVQDWLDFTQARLGGFRVNPEPVDLHALARAVVDETQASFPARRIELQTVGDLRGMWDPDRVTQLVSNLLHNALKYSPHDTTVQVRTRGGGDSVEVEVHNDGPPIPPDAISRLFAPFERATSQKGDSGGSVGLGLYIVKRIADAHGGTVDVTSTRAEGTTFRVLLPRKATRSR